jgi:hypothetical protein
LFEKQSEHPCSHEKNLFRDGERMAGEVRKKKPRTESCAADNRQLTENDYCLSAFFSIFPAPPHFAQLLPALAASTQQACAQVFPASWALTQQPATLPFSAAANMIPAENNDAAAKAASDFESFFI